MTGEEQTLLRASLSLALIRNASFKCMIAAHSIIKLLCEYSDSDSGEISCENAAAARGNFGVSLRSGLILHSSLRDSISHRLRQRTGWFRQICQFTIESHAYALTKIWEEFSPEQGCMEMPFDVCQTALARLSAVAGGANDPGVISQHVGFDDATRRRLYARLNLKLPSQNLKESGYAPIAFSQKSPLCFEEAADLDSPKWAGPQCRGDFQFVYLIRLSAVGLGPIVEYRVNI